MIDLLRLCRLYYALPMAFILTLTIAYAHGEVEAVPWVGALRASIALALVICGGYVLNDVNDRAVDAVNAPHRPIASGRVRPAVGAAWGVLLLAGALIVAAFERAEFVATLAVVVGLLLFYDRFSKRIGWGKQLVVALLMTSIYPLAFAQVGDLSGDRVRTLYVFPAWLFLTALGYEILKDIRDVAGDQLVAKTWIARQPDRALLAARVCLVAGALVLFVPGVVGCGWVYLAIVPVAMLLGLATAVATPARAMVLVYAECVVVGIAATTDLLTAGG